MKMEPLVVVFANMYMIDMVKVVTVEIVLVSLQEILQNNTGAR